MACTQLVSDNDPGRTSYTVTEAADKIPYYGCNRISGGGICTYMANDGRIGCESDTQEKAL